MASPTIMGIKTWLTRGWIDWRVVFMVGGGGSRGMCKVFATGGEMKMVHTEKREGCLQTCRRRECRSQLQQVCVCVLAVRSRWM